MLHGRWVRPGQGPWLTDGFAKPLSVDESSIAHLKNVKVVRQGDFVGVVGPVEYEVVQAAAQLKVKWAESPILPGHANLWNSFRKADSAGKMPARITTHRRQLRRRVQVGREDGLGVVHGPVQRPHADRARLRGRRLQALGGAGQGHRHRVLATRRTSSTTVAGIQSTLGLEDAAAGARHLLRGLELVRQRLPLPRHQRVRSADVEAGRCARPPAADAVGRAGLEQVRPGDHARHACAASTRTATSSRTRPSRSRRPAPATPPSASCSATCRRRRAPAGTNAENLAPMYKVAQNALGTRATA